MRRALALFLSLILFISFIPISVESNGFIKEIDVLFGGFQLTINSKRVANHKEPFLYEDDLFVSLSDLAKGLEMDIGLRNNDVYLNSRGKLSPDAYGSKQPLVFQRGYENIARERIVESLDDEVRLLSGGKLSKTDYRTKSTVKNIKVGFGNIAIYLDGKKLNLNISPIKYLDDVFVSLDSIAPYLYITPSLSTDKTKIDVDANGILVNHTSFSSIDALLSMREGRNYLLDLQKSELENKKYILGELKLPYGKLTTIQSLENYLNNNFGFIKDLNVEIKLSKQSSWIDLDISFPTSKNTLWYKLKRSDVEQWIWNIYTAVLNLYDSEALISGAVKSPYYNYYSNSNLRNYISFYTRDKDIYFDFTNSRLLVDDRFDADYLVEYLNANLSKYLNMNFDYGANMSGDNVELVIYPSSDNFNKLSLYSKMGYLKMLNQKIKTLYPSLNVDGKIVFPSSDILPIDFHISENRVRSKGLLTDTMANLNRSFGYFASNNYGFRLNYSLYEIDLENFHLVAEANFSVEDENWINSGSSAVEALNSTIHGALSSVVSLWDANVTVDILDKNGVPISEFDYYQEKVSIVSANPSGGQIDEGTLVVLWTNTSDASIYYTTDGSTPTTDSYVYDGVGIPINKGITTVKAFGYKTGLKAGDVSTFTYNVITVPTLSEGLTGLEVDPGTLVFSKEQVSYTVSVGKNDASIKVIPYADKGVIRVNDQIVANRQPHSVALGIETTNISISVKEEDKTEKKYSITVRKESGGSQFGMEDLRFSTLLNKLVFSGRVKNNSISNYTNFKVQLLTKTGKVIETVDISPDGRFAFPNKDLDYFDVLFGFKYKVLDSKNNNVLEKNLN